MWIVIGSSGQLGRALMNCAKGRKFNLIGSDRTDCDLSAAVSSIKAFARAWPETVQGVILCAADTNVDRAEQDPQPAFNVNTRAPALIAAECARRQIPLIYISTDYVFDGGSPRPYRANDPARPVNWYGQSKYEGENHVRAEHPQSLIVRTSWVYDETGPNFLTTMLSLARQNQEVRVVEDQIGRPTFAGHLALALLHVIRTIENERKTALSGTYHITGGGQPVSWACFARNIFKQAGLDVPVRNIPSSAFPRPAPRPANSVLDMTDFETRFGFAMPDWQDGIKAALGRMQPWE